MANTSVFDFANYQAYLQHVREHYPGRRTPLTLAQWAKRLGYRSPRSLAMVLKAQRLPTASLVQALVRDLKLNNAETRYLDLLVSKARQERNGRDTRDVEAELRRLNPRRYRRLQLRDREFSRISEWHYLPIEQLAGSPDFREDPHWISRRLCHRISPSQATKALRDLEQMGLLERDAAGRLQPPPPERCLDTTYDIPSLAIRRHQVQMMQRAVEALKERPIEEREYHALSVRVNPSRMREIKQRIRDFAFEMDRLYFDPSSPDVFQLNVQFFGLTDRNTTQGNVPS